MIIHIEAVRSFTIPNPPTGGTLVMDEGTTVEAAYRILGIDANHPCPPRPFVNGTRVAHSHVLTSEDRLFLFYPLSGG